MDALGNRNDEHDDCNGELILDKKHDAYYCTGCGKWVDDICGNPDCRFCKNRPDIPKKKEIQEKCACANQQGGACSFCMEEKYNL